MQLSENPKPSERKDQVGQDADLESRLRGYLKEVGEDADAVFNTMWTLTDGGVVKK